MLRKVVIFLFVLLASVASAQSWQPKAWQQYLIELNVRKDTIPQLSSIMCPKNVSTRRIDTRPFRCGPYYMPDPPSLFEAQDEAERWRRIERDGYHTTDLVCDILNGVLQVLFE
ncbi:hypothetical protein ETF27_10765 [Prevotella brunnea]|uniref:Uncharacterized protein n=1 Tax=Prevotella brunnea TaxID=2508867 RepID=A0A5C8G7Y6_9BACT|nr:hypothetical protein [Prevotella brunnea]MDR0186416.1 hypothetical protein [Prevotella brunnea]TXJ57917.1 hypothetical protein ETF27_10765 [Prevotella brunnea]